MNTSNQFIIQGTPTKVGRYSFRLRATDPLGNTSERDYNLDIIGIANDSELPDADAFVPYSETLVMDGPAVAEFWDVVSGTLPNLFTLERSTGVISGTTDSPEGDYPFRVRVTTTLGFQCEKDFIIHVNNPCPDWFTMDLGSLVTSFPPMQSDGFRGVLTDTSYFSNPFPGWVPCMFNPLTVLGPPVPMWSWHQYYNNTCPCFFDPAKYSSSTWSLLFPFRTSACGCTDQDQKTGCECPGGECEERIFGAFEYLQYNVYFSGSYQSTNMTRRMWVPVIKGRPCRCRLFTRQLAVPSFPDYAAPLGQGQSVSVVVWNFARTSSIQILIDPGWYVGVPLQWTQSPNWHSDGISWIDFIVNQDVVGNLGDPRWLEIVIQTRAVGFSNPTPPHSAITGWYQLVGKFINLGVI